MQRGRRVLRERCDRHRPGGGVGEGREHRGGGPGEEGVRAHPTDAFNTVLYQVLSYSYVSYALSVFVSGIRLVYFYFVFVFSFVLL